MCKELNLIDSNYVSFLEFQDKEIVRTHNILDIYPNLKTYKHNYLNSEHTQIALDISSDMPYGEYDEKSHNWNNNKEYYAKSNFSIDRLLGLVSSMVTTYLLVKNLSK